MTVREPPRPTTRLTPWISAVALLVLVAAVTATLGYRSLAPSPSATTLPTAAVPLAPRSRDGLSVEPRSAPGEAGGVVPAGVTGSDDQFPVVANLSPALLAALRRATVVAASDGLAVVVNSGWRSPRYREQLLQKAIPTYGSAAQAARLVATPGTSAHVPGGAADLGPADATAWLSEHGAAYRLCQVSHHEPWHCARRPRAVDRGCPPLYADPARDPRLRP